MSTEFPTALDTLLNPNAGDALANATPGLQHHAQHSDANDAIEALEAKVGIDSSADTNSIDYKVRNGGSIRKNTQVTTDSLAADTTDSAKTLTLGKGGIALKITTDYPAWVRVYSSTDAQTADASRPITTDPEAGAGVLLEVLTATGALTINLSPTAVLFSATGETTIPITVTNKDTETRSITVTVTTVPLEG